MQIADSNYPFFQANTLFGHFQVIQFNTISGPYFSQFLENLDSTNCFNEYAKNSAVPYETTNYYLFHL